MSTRPEKFKPSLPQISLKQNPSFTEGFFGVYLNISSKKAFISFQDFSSASLYQCPFLIVPE